MTDFPVLIVGAGPTGMELAAELHQHGIKFLIIDKRPNHVTTSNAAGVHARTLECWHGRPWHNQFIQKGLKIDGVTINSKSGRLATFDFDQLKHTQYPYILSIPQNETESILDSYLATAGIPVKRNATLTGLASHDDHVEATISTPESEETITADWVVGCDGYHSTVRELEKIEFQGADLKERFFLIDANLKCNYEQNMFHVYLDDKGISAFFRMPESTRIIAGVGDDPSFKYAEKPSLELMSELIRQRTSLNFTLDNADWNSHFWIHERLAKRYRSGRIFLAGDAAHVHSPAGGQGMNTGIQDSYNLAWKLAYVIRKKAPASLLDSYEIERRQIAESVVDMTSKMTSLASLHNSFLISLRNLIMPRVTTLVKIKNLMIGRMSQLSLCYRSNSINQGKTISSFSPGDRAPDAKIDKDANTYLYDVLKRSTHYFLLVFNSSNDNTNKLKLIENKYNDVMSVCYCENKNTELFDTYPFKGFVLCLIRPDQYIGYLGNDAAELDSYLQSQFLTVNV